MVFSVTCLLDPYCLDQSAKVSYNERLLLIRTSALTIALAEAESLMSNTVVNTCNHNLELFVDLHRSIFHVSLQGPWCFDTKYLVIAIIPAIMIIIYRSDGTGQSELKPL